MMLCTPCMFLVVFTAVSDVGNCYPTEIRQNFDTGLPVWERDAKVCASDIINLTQEYPRFIDEYKDIVVKERSSISHAYLKQKAAEHGKVRISVEDSMSYIIINHLKNQQNKDEFTVNEWDFKEAVSDSKLRIKLPLSAELVQNTIDGTGSISASLSVEVVPKYKLNGVFNLQIFPKYLISVIPGFFLGFQIKYARKASKIISLSTTISGLASCSASNGHKLTTLLDVGLTKYTGIRVKEYTYHEDLAKWYSSDVIYEEGNYDPIASVICVVDQ